MMRAIGGATRRDTLRRETREADQTAAARVAELIGRREVDAATIIGALVVVVVVLILTAELDQVVPFQLRQVIAKEVVLTIPETGTDILCIDVVGRKSCRRDYSPNGSRAPPSPAS